MLAKCRVQSELLCVASPAREENSYIAMKRVTGAFGLALAIVSCASPASRKDAPKPSSGASAPPVWNLGGDAANAQTSRAGDAGCAQYGYVFTDEAPQRIADHVPFALGSASVPPDGKATLDKLAASLNQPHPKIVRLAILGYAAPGEDKVLSQGRANAVLGELIARGVPSHRLEAHGVKGDLPPGLPRAAVVFEVLVEYRGGLQRWADAGLVACSPDDPSLECGIPAEAERTCIRKPQ